MAPPQRLIWFNEATGTPLSLASALAVATYYSQILDVRSIPSVHLRWDATLVGSITIERSNDPTATTIAAGTTGQWITATALGNPTPAAAPGGDIIDLVGSGTAFARLRASITTGGQLIGWANRTD